MWTEEARAKCLELWNTGNFSMGDLAAELGCTRNSLAGCLNRLRKWGHQVLSKQTSEEYVKRVNKRNADAQKRPRITLNRPARRKPKPVIQQLFDLADFHPPLRQNLFELKRNECKFVFGEDSKNFAFCGYPTDIGQSYCAVHHKVVWVRPAR